MPDRYIDFANSGLGHRLVAALGLPVTRYAWSAGRPGVCARSKAPCYSAVAAGGQGAGIATNPPTPSTPTAPKPRHGSLDMARRSRPWYSTPVNLQHTEQLKQLREFFQPLLKSLDNSAHLVILGRAPRASSTHSRPVPSAPLKASAGPWPRTAQRWRAAIALRRCTARGPTGRRAALLPLAQKRVHLRPGDPPGSLRHAGRGLDPPAGRAHGAGHRSRPRHWRGHRRNPRPRRRRGGPARCAPGQDRPRRSGRAPGCAQRGAGHLRRRRRRPADRSNCPTASTSWCTTPASPATRPWPT